MAEYHYARSTVNNRSIKKPLMITAGIFLLLALVWIVVAITKPGDDANNNQQPQNTNSQSIPAEPTNPNVTGGSDGAGTGTSNDSSTTTPSPAGGVDTNNTTPYGGE